MKSIVAAVTLSLLSIPGYAETWLCIGEHGAQVRTDREQVIDSSSFPLPIKLLVDETGLRIFGDEEHVIETCIPQKNGGMICRDGNEFNQFLMLPTKIFRFVSVGIDDTGHSVHTLVMGKCSKISD